MPGPDKTPDHTRQTMRQRTLRLIAVVVLFGSITGIGGATGVHAAEPVTLRVGTAQNLDSLNPFTTTSLIGYEVFTLNYDLLVGFGPDNEPVPGFASSWSQSADGLTWTFKVRPGAEWSDGLPATAEDARFTFQYILDAIHAGKSVGYGYLDSYVTDAAVSAVSAPDPTTLVITTTRPNSRVLASYVPILPEHIWKNVKLDKVSDFKNGAPVVGSGPYQVSDWQDGQFTKLVRNPHYWGRQGAEDQIIFQFFPGSTSTMVTAFKTGELDYIRNPGPDSFAQLKADPSDVAINATGNSFTQINFNTYAKDVPKGGASTKALRDPAFRAALGYAIDRDALISRVLGGYGTAGTTQIPAWQRAWHVEPNDLRAFDLARANAALDAAGYPLKDGVRYDKQGKPISLSLMFPNSNPAYPKVAQFIAAWFAQVGIKVSSQSLDAGALGAIEYLDASAPLAGQLKYDMVIWSWVGSPDPNTMLQVLTTGAISVASDSQWSNARYDALYDLQNKATTASERKAYLTEMQQLFYDQAPYQILYYEDDLHVYHDGKFSGWSTQPSNGGTPLFVNGSLGYTRLIKFVAPAPSAQPAGPSPVLGALGPVPAPSPAGPEGFPLIVIVLLAVLACAGFALIRRRRTTTDED